MTDTGRIRITVDGRLALTTKQAAERYGVKTATMRGELSRYQVAPTAHLDDRTPLYHVAVLDRVMKARPGKGIPHKQR